jgi:hypothetical protein
MECEPGTPWPDDFDIRPHPDTMLSGGIWIWECLRTGRMIPWMWVRSPRAARRFLRKQYRRMLRGY